MRGVADVGRVGIKGGALRRQPRYMARPPPLARCARSGILAGGFAPAATRVFIELFM